MHYLYLNIILIIAINLYNEFYKQKTAKKPKIRIELHKNPITFFSKKIKFGKAYSCRILFLKSAT